MAKRENVSTFARKGKPAGSEKDLGSLDEINNEIGEIDGVISMDEVEIKHPNRHLHKGEDLPRFTNRDDDEDEP